MQTIETLQQELGIRMMSLEAQRPYKDLTPANFEAYRTQYETILDIERKIEQLTKHQNRIKTIEENEELEYQRQPKAWSHADDENDGDR
jgi:hypothetical protein